MADINRITFSIILALTFLGHTVVAHSDMSEKTFFEKRAALIIKHSHHDATFSALQKEKQTKGSFTPEYWRWRVDQYLYGQYPEYQAIYDAYTQGKKFNNIYDLPSENLGPKWEKPIRLPSIPKGYFTDNLPGNALTGWDKLVDDNLYITYQGHLTDPYVTRYNIKTHQWGKTYQAGNSTLSKGERKIDSHGRPIIEIDNKGYIHIVFGGHGGEREDGLNPLSIDTPHAGGRMIHIVSDKPHDLSRFSEKNDITPFASYTKSYKMGNGDIYFFTRAGTHKSPWLYYKMKNGAQTFEAPVMISWPTPQKDDPILVDTFYINPVKVSETKIVITSLWHACNFKETHNKTHYNRLNAYYMTLDTTDDTFYNVEGKQLVLPLTLSAANQYTLAYNSHKVKETSFGTEPLVLKDGTPALAYEALGEGYREWRMAKYSNGKWSHGHPMPDTADRVVRDLNGKLIKNVIALKVLKSQGDIVQAAITYKNNANDSVFATVKKISNQNWQVDKEHFNVSKARLRMKAVKDSNIENIAVILNVKKGQSQRLYLWHDGKFRMQ